MHDIIGDIHGHSTELLLLLGKLGYQYQNGAYRHPERQAVFLGDYIDRGPDSLQCLDIVRAMVENGSAVALMGNHEYNAICFHQEDEKGGHLRPHSIKNFLQHEATMRAFKGNESLYEEYIQWFRSLPMYYETIAFRAVHACWHPESLSEIKKQLSDGQLDSELASISSDPKSSLYRAVENVLKGVEISLPEGVYFHDKDGNIRTEARIKWWADGNSNSYKDLAIGYPSDGNHGGIDIDLFKQIPFYPTEEKPVFFGHYWLRGKPYLTSSNAGCLDFSVAKGGVLAAYRFDGERELSVKNLVWV